MKNRTVTPQTTGTLSIYVFICLCHNLPTRETIQRKIVCDIQRTRQGRDSAWWTVVKRCVYVCGKKELRNVRKSLAGYQGLWAPDAVCNSFLVMCLNHLHVAKSQQMNQRCFSSKFLHLEFRVRDLERCPKRGQNRVCDDPLLFPALLPKPPLSSWYFTALAEVELKSCRRCCCSASLSFKSEQRHQVQSLFFNLLSSPAQWIRSLDADRLLLLLLLLFLPIPQPLLAAEWPNPTERVEFVNPKTCKWSPLVFVKSHMWSVGAHKSPKTRFGVGETSLGCGWVCVFFFSVTQD